MSYEDVISCHKCLVEVEETVQYSTSYLISHGGIEMQVVWDQYGQVCIDEIRVNGTPSTRLKNLVKEHLEELLHV